MAMTVKVVKAPAWMTKGIDLKPMIEASLETIGQRMERQGKGVGARRNTLSRQKGPLEQRVFTSLHNPRQTGLALKRKDEGIFKSMAPAVVRNKIIKPLEAEWGKTGPAP